MIESTAFMMKKKINKKIERENKITHRIKMSERPLSRNPISFSTEKQRTFVFFFIRKIHTEFQNAIAQARAFFDATKAVIVERSTDKTPKTVQNTCYLLDSIPL